MESKAELALNERLKILIKKLGLSQREVCLKSKIEPPAFNRAFHGHAVPRFDMMEALYRAFPSINPHFLLTGEGNIFGSDQSGLEKCLAENEVLKDKLKDKEKIIALLESKR